ncbi:MAG: hypothetical protein KBB86_01590 [Candidatus Pacebacteria bacterium]|nr:hypothetical protein [Candidatus Paceibacterota bacterium]
MENLNNPNEVVDGNENQPKMAMLNEALNDAGKVLELADNSTDLSPETLKKVAAMKKIKSLFPNFDQNAVLN